jgi:hypothetical protein
VGVEILGFLISYSDETGVMFVKLALFLMLLYCPVVIVGFRLLQHSVQ